MAQVVFNNVSKVYADGTRAVSSLELTVDDGEFMVFVGPSGCGKTSALRMVGGLEAISEGELVIGDRVANTLGPKERDVAMVFQNYALYPHMSVFDNIAFPLRAHGVPGSEIKERVPRIAQQLALDEHLRRRPRNLSGGQRQRVAMGRALIREPQVFLMDEPLSNLDAKLRVEMRAEVTRLQHELGVTTIYVTHDQVEAMTMGNRIAVMRKGVLEQEGAPQALYNEPANLFVAQFIGSPAMTLFRATLAREDGHLILALGNEKLVLPRGYLDDRPALGERLGREVAVGLRPEHLRDGVTAPAGLPRVRADVTLVETLGPERHVHVRLPAPPVVTDDVLEVARDTDAALASELSEHAGETTSRAIARFEADAEVAPGEARELAIVPDKLRFFDLQTGAAI
jgi:multiple sugar transport system ATP-binding protein